MNKIVTSVGLFAVGVSALHAAESSTLNPLQRTKPWSVQATLNGFYDDNVESTSINNQGGVESTGFDITPSIKFGLPGEQTSFNVGYAFTARYYDKTAPTQSKDDYTHVFDLDFAHAFSPRFDMTVDESFVIGQEPDLILDPAGVQRFDGDNMRNFAGIGFNAGMTEMWSLGIGYRNAFYDYDDELPTTLGGTQLPGDIVIGASNSGLLDRLEHKVPIDSKWQLSPQTVGILGYAYSQFNYTSDEIIAGTIGGANQVPSDYRDSRGHTFYVGSEHVFSPTLSGFLSLGAQYFSYYNDPSSESQWSPYAQGGLTYALQAATTADIGFRYERAAANEAGLPGAQFVRDTEVATFFANLKHEIFRKFFGTLNGAVSDSKYNGGGPGIDGEHQLYYRVGLDFSYEFSQNFSGHIGYNYDEVSSDLPGRDYDRNRVYCGVTAGF
jgi:hypothetical protein